MKLFYTLMLTALLGLFGVGCNGDGPKEGDPDPNKPLQVGEFTVTSQVQASVEVKSGDLSVTLTDGKCIQLDGAQAADLQISIPSWFGEAKVLCGPSEDGSVNPCEAKSVIVGAALNQDVDGDGNLDNNVAVIFDNPNPLKCTEKLEEEKEDESGSENDEEGGDNGEGGVENPEAAPAPAAEGAAPDASADAS